MNEFEIKLLKILNEINDNLIQLGTNNADTGMGALEIVAKEIHELGQIIATK